MQLLTSGAHLFAYSLSSVFSPWLLLLGEHYQACSTISAHHHGRGFIDLHGINGAGLLALYALPVYVSGIEPWSIMALYSYWLNTSSIIMPRHLFSLLSVIIYALLRRCSATFSQASACSPLYWSMMMRTISDWNYSLQAEACIFMGRKLVIIAIAIAKSVDTKILSRYFVLEIINKATVMPVWLSAFRHDDTVFVNGSLAER